MRLPELRVMGVDPGLTRCGLGAVEGRPGAPLSLVKVGVVRTPADDELGARLVAIEAGIEQWLDEVRPDAVAVERVFSQHNLRTVMGTAQAAAVAILCAARRGLPVALHTPSEVKAAITGSGTADKQQVATMVTRLLRLDAMPSPPTPPTRWRWRSATCGGAGRRTGWPRPWPGTKPGRRTTAAAYSGGGAGPDTERNHAVIATVRGRVAAIAPDGAVVEVGGVGCAVHCTPGTLATLRVGEQARLATSLVVREESLTLFGFADDDERGVVRAAADGQRGRAPRWPRRCWPCTRPNALRAAVASADVKALTRVPGIGQKGAERHHRWS